MLEWLRDLYHHMEWADATVWRAAVAHGPAADDASIRAKLHHLHLVQRAFLSVWRGEAFSDSGDSFGELMPWAREYYANVRAHLATLDDAALGRPVILPWAERLVAPFGRAPSPTTLRDTMTQVAMHSTYHRGQVNMRMRELGAEPPLTDFIAWLWLGKPAAEWKE